MPFFNDNKNVYEKLSKHCHDNGLNIGFVITDLIEKKLIDLGILKKK